MTLSTVELFAISNLFADRAKSLPRAVSPFGFHTPNLCPPSRAAVDYVRRSVASGEPIVEKRGAPRMRVAFSARAVALGPTWQPIGDEFPVVVRSVSASGLGLFSSVPFESLYLAIELAARCGETIVVVVKVGRCQALGPCFDVVGTFVRHACEPRDKSIYDALSGT